MIMFFPLKTTVILLLQKKYIVSMPSNIYYISKIWL